MSPNLVPYVYRTLERHRPAIEDLYHRITTQSDENYDDTDAATMLLCLTMILHELDERKRLDS